ncbi:MAG: 30S ribosomal protein S18 [Candidatus Schekmanbacteria bacterium RIFCSPHIGHO2_02_FULL_38_11]|uniref:Small ribosomal subunit protein bS18 n=1 Tax=Candidatus Schekmanbacteria bacterium RIFCSPLOWO2_12_FULL_38_15 TaxID=1817883 RepID=A0A1F7SJR7_9BACT|nr:MAG: 30S ribosomal protein S18 [Candidatus Schekmanbacteria bacterium GWA2_38_9]OGL51690.1 MAG: 30S ribosomal protein S18 [Candidatus Schekmanbacteria bacterium RIFCSPLOWO2_02_FULL_38_14]OGL52359.1 MAG: 30S ribosomal protein S18 [Candidatus Schekmanbacteria bacterium RIFCSPHIGHO2_02_FULL_38_11]OGL54013.1 MAG: 30S ribosomal protein S18 [Candidatus Schekmanbacteria bacterium RIFCSPLOWO2_12_FULL_38_15]
MKRPKFQKKKRIILQKRFCGFCSTNTDIDYKEIKKLKSFVTERGKIMPRRISGNCAKHQRSLTTAIKRARNMALLPFTVNK